MTIHVVLELSSIGSYLIEAGNEIYKMDELEVETINLAEEGIERFLISSHLLQHIFFYRFGYLKHFKGNLR